MKKALFVLFCSMVFIMSGGAQDRTELESLKKNGKKTG